MFILVLLSVMCCSLSASKDPFGVTLGGILGHSLCTGIAVIGVPFSFVQRSHGLGCAGGRMLAARISEKTMLLLGGGECALSSLFSCPL